MMLAGPRRPFGPSISRPRSLTSAPAPTAPARRSPPRTSTPCDTGGYPDRRHRFVLRDDLTSRKRVVRQRLVGSSYMTSRLRRSVRGPVYVEGPGAANAGSSRRAERLTLFDRGIGRRSPVSADVLRQHAQRRHLPHHERTTELRNDEGGAARLSPELAVRRRAGDSDSRAASACCPRGLEHAVMWPLRGGQARVAFVDAGRRRSMRIASGRMSSPSVSATATCTTRFSSRRFPGTIREQPMGGGLGQAADGLPLLAPAISISYARGRAVVGRSEAGKRDREPLIR